MSENTEILNDSPAETAAPKKSSAKKRVGIVCGVIAVIVAIAGFGMWTWHDDPSFCGTVCHTPMASYLETYDHSDDQSQWFEKIRTITADLGYAVKPKDYKKHPDEYKGSVADLRRHHMADRQLHLSA